jgi:hypothetical protein
MNVSPPHTNCSMYVWPNWARRLITRENNHVGVEIYSNETENSVPKPYALWIWGINPYPANVENMVSSQQFQPMTGGI